MSCTGKQTLNHLVKLAKWLRVHYELNVVGSSPVAITSSCRSLTNKTRKKMKQTWKKAT